MRIFNRAKHEVYKNLAEGIVNQILESRQNDIETGEVYNALEYYDLTGKHLYDSLYNIMEYKKDAPIIVEYVADNLLKRGHVDLPFMLYKKVNPKKASVLEKLFPNDFYENTSDDRCEFSVGRKLDEIMSKYEKNPEIPFIPPQFM